MFALIHSLLFATPKRVQRLAGVALGCCLCVLAVFGYALAAQAQQDAADIPFDEKTEAEKAAALAEARRYEIELLVFKTQKEPKKPPLLQNLRYPEVVDRLPESVEQAITAIDNYGQYLLLTDSDGSLGDTIEDLEGSGRKVIYYQRWRQIIPPRDQERFIVVEGGKQFDNYHELQGYIGLYLSRYIHADLELWLSDYDRKRNSKQKYPPLPPRPEEKEDVQIFNTVMGPFKRVARNIMDTLNASNKEKRGIKHIVRLQEKRRMRSREIHYFDHPTFGALILVTPVEKT